MTILESFGSLEGWRAAAAPTMTRPKAVATVSPLEPGIEESPVGPIESQEAGVTAYRPSE